MVSYALTQNANDDDYCVYVTAHSSKSAALKFAKANSYVPAYRSNDPHVVVDGNTELGAALATLNPPLDPRGAGNNVRIKGDNKALARQVDAYAEENADSWFALEG